MTHDEELTYHRTFLLFHPKSDLCKMGCHGTTGIGRKLLVDDNLVTLDEQFIGQRSPISAVDWETDLRRRGREQPNYHFQYQAFQLSIRL